MVQPYWDPATPAWDKVIEEGLLAEEAAEAEAVAVVGDVPATTAPVMSSPPIGCTNPRMSHPNTTLRGC